MSDDIRLSIGFWGHPKTKKLQKKLGLKAIRSMQILWLWAAQNKPSGILAAMSVEDIELAADWNGKDGELCSALTETGWIEHHDGIYSIHDWSEHQPWVIGAESRKKKATCAAQTRWDKVKRDATSMLQACPEQCSTDELAMPLSIPYLSKTEDKDISGGPAAPIDPKAFSGFVIYHQDGEMRINNRDLESWKSAYFHLDIPAQLQSLSDWTRETREWTKKDAFHRTSATLKLRDERARILADEKRKDEARQDKKPMTAEERKRAEWLASGQAVN